MFWCQRCLTFHGHIFSLLVDEFLMASFKILPKFFGSISLFGTGISNNEKPVSVTDQRNLIFP